MNSFKASRLIEAPPEAVWSVLDDVGSIAEWNPCVKQSHRTSPEATGLGATRHCDLGKAGSLDEEIVAYHPKEAITFRITRSNMPFARADIHFTLTPEEDGTRVTVNPIYRMKFGPLGWLMDVLMVRRIYRRGMEQLLEGWHAEQPLEVVAAG